MLARLSLIFILLSVTTCTFAETELYINHKCGRKDIDVFYKAGSETAVENKINDTLTKYDIPITEPTKIYIVTDETTRNIETVWMLPTMQSRSVTIDNCQNKLTYNDTISLDAEHAPYKKVESDWKAGVILYDSLMPKISTVEEAYIIAHPDSFLAVYYLNDIKQDLSIEKVSKYLSLVGKNNSGYKCYAEIKQYVDNVKYKGSPKIGDSFFEFTAQQVDGKVFDSKEVSNKTVLLFFWYSGCGPCHKAMPSLATMYDKYKSKGLEIISYSLDDKEEDWKNASSKFNAPGISVSNLQGFNSPLFFHYAVSAFPFFVLFDKEKKISMITYGEEEVGLIEEKLKELLK